MASVKRAKAVLVLATGRVFTGWSFGAIPGGAIPGGAIPGGKKDSRPATGEVVFNTSLSGYQEILTDPSYQGQIVAMTASHIGNYGINPEDMESRRIFLSGFVVQELSNISSNWRANETLDAYLSKAGVAGMTGVDVRALTKHLRELGSVNGLISTDGTDVKTLIKKAKAIPSLEGQDLTHVVTADKPYEWTHGSGEWREKIDSGKNTTPTKYSRRKVVVMDFGVKQNILRCLVDRNCDVTVVPANTPASEILNLKPDGIMISNGPGDPAAVTTGIGTIKDLIDYNLTRQKKGEKGFAIFGICLGHQMLGLALGGKTFKLKFGHHGANHPIKDVETGRVDITTQNHGFAVEGEKQKDDTWALKGNKEIICTHVNLNDFSIAGLRHRDLPLFSVQYHPEASAGPHDARHLFDRFLKLMDSKTN